MGATTDEPVLDRVQVAHLFLKASSGETTVITTKEAEAAIKRLFSDLFDQPPLYQLAADLIVDVENDVGRPHYSQNVRTTLELIRVELGATATAK